MGQQNQVVAKQEFRGCLNHSLPWASDFERLWRQGPRYMSKFSCDAVAEAAAAQSTVSNNTSILSVAQQQAIPGSKIETRNPEPLRP